MSELSELLSMSMSRAAAADRCVQLAPRCASDSSGLVAAGAEEKGAWIEPREVNGGLASARSLLV